jgi:uncharacterized membrane protein HdeD (DUF308 family)
MYYRRLREDFNEIHKSWGWFLALGICLTVLGFAALGSAGMATLASMFLLGWLICFSGLLEIGVAFGSEKWGGFFANLFAGVLYMVVGGVIVGYPMASATMITMLLATLFLIGGTFRIITATALQHPNWGWVAFDGIITAVLGALIWAQWPSSSLWVLGTFVGINLVFRGLGWTMFALAARRSPSSEQIFSQPEKREHAKRF